MSQAIQVVKDRLSVLKNAINSQLPPDEKVSAAVAGLDEAISALADAPSKPPAPVISAGFPKVMSAEGKSDMIVDTPAEENAAIASGYALKS